MDLIEILTITAIILGPIIAVQLEKYLERNREERNRRMYVFKTLMATRGAVLSVAHVEALNRIDLEFSNNKKYHKVISAWKEYFDNLCNKAETTEAIAIWSARNDELLANLLFEMGQSLGYDFDKVLIKRNVYSPVGHGKIEKENELIRHGLINILHTEKPIPVSIEHVELNEETVRKQNQLQNLMIEHYRHTTGQYIQSDNNEPSENSEKND